VEERGSSGDVDGKNLMSGRLNGGRRLWFLQVVKNTMIELVYNEIFTWVLAKACDGNQNQSRSIYICFTKAKPFAS
jgi:hypothetical protein